MSPMRTQFVHLPHQEHYIFSSVHGRDEGGGSRRLLFAEPRDCCASSSSSADLLGLARPPGQHGRRCGPVRPAGHGGRRTASGSRRSSDFDATSMKYGAGRARSELEPMPFRIAVEHGPRRRGRSRRGQPRGRGGQYCRPQTAPLASLSAVACSACTAAPVSLGASGAQRRRGRATRRHPRGRSSTPQQRAVEHEVAEWLVPSAARGRPRSRYQRRRRAGVLDQQVQQLLPALGEGGSPSTCQGEVSRPPRGSCRSCRPRPRGRRRRCTAGATVAPSPPPRRCRGRSAEFAGRAAVAPNRSGVWSGFPAVALLPGGRAAES